MKNNYFKIIIVFLITTISFGQVAISYPTPAEGVTASYGSSYLYVRLDFNQVATAGADVTITLPTGFTYVASSLIQINTNAGLTIAESGGTANAPQFKVAPFSIGIGNWISFKIKRQATCTAISGTNFKDQISATTSAGTVQDVDTSQNNYDLVYPAISFDQPVSQSNALLNVNYTRTFTISNGGNGAANAIYFSINYPIGITQVSLNLGATVLTPTSTVGTIKYYTIPSGLLPSGVLANGQSLDFTEVFKLTKCDITTTYNVGWGDNATTWCQTVGGTGATSMETGVPTLGVVSGAKVGYVDQCTAYITRFTYQNGATGTSSASGMYNVVLREGSSNGGVTYNTVSYRNFIQYLSATIGSQSGIVVPNGTIIGSFIDLNLIDKFTSDPDGIGVGLDDLDGDGFYDDLPAGKIVSVDFQTQVNPTAFICPQEWGNYYDSSVSIYFKTMCGAQLSSSIKSAGNFQGGGYSQMSSKSYAPANVYGGIPFRVRFAYGVQNFFSPFDNVNTRFVYEVTLPLGVTVSGTGNVVWRNGQYPSGGAGASTTYSQTGNILTVTSLDKNPGWFEITLVYDCSAGATSLSFPFKFKRFDNIVTGCINSNADVMCKTLDIPSVICTTPCLTGGPSMSYAKVERADNSLGWTNGTLSTRQFRSAITDYDLSKALYLDEIWMNSNATYGSSGTGLYQRFVIKKTVNTDDKLTPLDMLVVVKRGVTTLFSGTITTFSGTGTTTSKQYVNWDFSSINTAISGFQNGDVIETKARYTVSSNNLPDFDVQTGESLSFYSLDNVGTELSCQGLIPEMYLVAPKFTDAGGSTNVSSCGFIGSGALIAYRFAANGTKFLNEIRPGLLPTTYTFTVPVGYSLQNVTWQGYNNSYFSSTPLTATLISGSTYAVVIPLKTFEIEVTNYFNYSIGVNLAPTCASATTTNVIGNYDYVPYYYHYAGNASMPITNVSFTKALNYSQITKPVITLSNQSGTIQASKPTESFTVRMASTGTTTAPYTWLSIPTVAGVNITSVVDVSSGTTLTPTTYAGGVWFPISTTGLVSGASKDYRIYFTYSNCGTVSFPVEAGWNCLSYPTDPSTYTCGKATVNLSYTTSLAEIQVTEIPQAVSTALCASQNHLFEISNSQASNVKDSTFTLTMPVGYLPVGASFQVEYPRNSGTWQTVVPTIVSNVYTFNLTTHTNYPTQGIPGTINSTTADDRFMMVKFQTNTDCDYVPGSKFQYSVAAKGSCGAVATGSNINTYSN